MDEDSFLNQCHLRVDKLQRLLHEDPAVCRLLKRRESTDHLNEELFSKLDKEHDSLKRAGKRLKARETKVEEESKMASSAATAVQAQSVWKDYWASARVEELSQWLQVEKVHTADLSRRIALYEARFGRHF
jgi:hypothetical protein